MDAKRDHCCLSIQSRHLKVLHADFSDFAAICGVVHRHLTFVHSDVALRFGQFWSTERSTEFLAGIAALCLHRCCRHTALSQRNITLSGDPDGVNNDSVPAEGPDKMNCVV
jgi:hypothetical protein